MRMQVLTVVATLVLGNAFAADQDSVDTTHKTSNPPRHTCVSFDSNVGILEIRMLPEGLRSSLVVNGIVFQSIDKSEPIKIWGRGPANSFLFFHHSGMEIAFPSLATSVTVRVLQGAGPVVLQALDENGSTVDSYEVNKPNEGEQIVHLTSEIFAIRRIILTEGGNEGGIVYVCAVMQP